MFIVALCKVAFPTMLDYPDEEFARQHANYIKKMCSPHRPNLDSKHQTLAKTIIISMLSF